MKLKASDFKSPDLELYDEDDGTYFLAIGDPYAGDEYENRLANVDIAMLKNKGYEFEAIFTDQKLLCFRIQEHQCGKTKPAQYMQDEKYLIRKKQRKIKKAIKTIQESTKYFLEAYHG